MRLSKRTEYGLRAVVQLARLWPRNYVQSKDLAQQEGLPNKFLESILLALRRGAMVERDWLLGLLWPEGHGLRS